jgi:plastocyanin
MRPPTRGRCPQAALEWAAAILVLLAVLGPMPAAVAATLVIHVQTSEGRVLPGAVVTARPLDAPAPKVAPVRVVMDQMNRTFAPDLLVIPVGSTVEFPNSDSVRHQISSFSPAKRFQLPLYRGKPYPPVRFDQPGVVTLGCNIHDWMLAYLLVTDAPYFGRTDPSGAWSAELPRGRYRVTLWHPRLRESESNLERELTIGDGDRAELTVRLVHSLQPAPLTEHTHTHSEDY